jgi:DNA-binding NarL/FixJ family response regulator
MKTGQALRRIDASSERPPRVYSELNFEIKLRRDRMRPPILPEPSRVPLELIEGEREGLLETAGLTDRQWRVLLLHQQGYSFHEIGRSLGNSKQASHALYRYARRKLELAIHTYPYLGLSEVYAQETRRGYVPTHRRVAR